MEVKYENKLNNILQFQIKFISKGGYRAIVIGCGVVVGLLPLDRLPVSTYRRRCWWHGTSSDNGNTIGYGTEEEYILTSLGMLQQDMVVV